MGYRKAQIKSIANSVQIARTNKTANFLYFVFERTILGNIAIAGFIGARYLPWAISPIHLNSVRKLVRLQVIFIASKEVIIAIRVINSSFISIPNFKEIKLYITISEKIITKATKTG